MMHNSSYVIASSFAQTCIYDINTSQMASLPSLSKSVCLDNQLCNSRNLFKSIRDFYYPATVSNIVLPYVEMANTESKVSIVRNGSAFGYDNVTLISFEISSLIRAISATKLNPEKNDVCIVVFHLREQICATILQYDGEAWIPLKRYMLSVRTHHEDLKKFCHNLIAKAPLNGKYHDIIVAYSKEIYEGRKNFFKRVFTRKLHFVSLDRPDEYGYKGYLGGFMTKARCLSGDETMKRYDVASVSDFEYKAIVDGKDALNFKVQFQKIPFKKEHEIEVDVGSRIELYKRHFVSDKWVDDPAFVFLTRAAKIKLLLEIDANEIVDFQVTEFPADKPPSPSFAVKIKHPNVLLKKPPSSPVSFNLQTTFKRKRGSTPLEHHDSIAFSNIDEERLATERVTFDCSSPISASTSVEEHVEFVVLNKSFIVYHVSEFGRFPIRNNFDKTETPAYIALHCLPPLIGEEAQQQLEDHQDSTVYDFIPLFGKEFSQIEIDPKWKFDVVQSKDGRLADVQLQTFRGKRRSPISSLMAIMFKRLQNIAEAYVDFPVTEVRVTFADHLNFSDIDLLKTALNGAKLDLIEDE